MDTDDLTEMAWDVIVRAARVYHPPLHIAPQGVSRHIRTSMREL